MSCDCSRNLGLSPRKECVSWLPENWGPPCPWPRRTEGEGGRDGLQPRKRQRQTLSPEVSCPVPKTVPVRTLQHGHYPELSGKSFPRVWGILWRGICTLELLEKKHTSHSGRVFSPGWPFWHTPLLTTWQTWVQCSRSAGRPASDGSSGCPGQMFHKLLWGPGTGLFPVRLGVGLQGVLEESWSHPAHDVLH